MNKTKANRIKAIQCFMNEEDQEKVGFKAIYKEILNKWQIEAIMDSIDILKAQFEILDPDTLNYVVDDLGNEAIIPGLYNEFTGDYHIDSAYFGDLLPGIYKKTFTEKDKEGIIYLLREYNDVISLFLNDNAYEALKFMTPDEIKYTLTIGQQQKSKSR